MLWVPNIGKCELLNKEIISFRQEAQNGER
jgi:hypothetical protein